jgi:hypothetical protein
MQINTVTYTPTNISDNKYHKFMYEKQQTTLDWRYKVAISFNQPHLVFYIC